MTHIFQKLLAVVGIYLTPLVGAIDESLGRELLWRFRMLFEKRLDHLIEGGSAFAQAVSVDKEPRHDKDVALALIAGLIDIDKLHASYLHQALAEKQPLRTTSLFQAQLTPRSESNRKNSVKRPTASPRIRADSHN